MSLDKTKQAIKLKDGRTLGYAEYGVAKGNPIFEFHGNPSSRLGSRLFGAAACRLGIRVIGIDRPGMGLSDYKPDRKLLDWPDDVLELAKALAIDRFPIVGGSGGVPSVLACAYKIPERLNSVGILFGPRPLGTRGATDSWSRSRRIQTFLGRNGPLWISRLAMRVVASVMRKNPDEALSKMFKELPQSDKEAFNQPDVKQQYIDTIRETFRSGARGVALDYALNMKPWGFKLEDISIEVHLWHGEDDTVVPPTMGRYLAEAIPNCHARFLANEGHFSLLPNHADEILGALVT
jgi:pimeloyl-ACP methyl ester carboxylesterase